MTGMPLIDENKAAIVWEAQKKHVACIQDPKEIQLYFHTGILSKGDMDLPTYQCARGSSSLESFHLHLNRFIPGKLHSFHFLFHLHDTKMH